MPPNPVTSRATSRAAVGGQTDTLRSERPVISASPHPVSPAAAARSLVAALRPAGAHSTWYPAPARHCPTAAPISPGCRSPIVTSPMLPYIIRCRGARVGHHVFTEVAALLRWPAGARTCHPAGTRYGQDMTLVPSPGRPSAGRVPSEYTTL